MQKIIEKIKRYKNLQNGTIEKYDSEGADLETEIILHYLSKFNMPAWVREAALESVESREQTDFIIAEVLKECQTSQVKLPYGFELLRA